MEYAAISIEMIILLLIGFVFKWVYKDKIQNNTLKFLIFGFFLPILLFISFSDVKSGNLDILPFLFFGLIICIIYQIVFTILFAVKCYYPKDQKFLVLSTLATIAPGLTIYPFADRFLGRDSLAGLSMMNLGIKIYIFTYIYYMLNRLIKQKMHELYSNHKALHVSKLRSLMIASLHFIEEPVIIAIVAGLIFYLCHASLTTLSPPTSYFLNMLGDVCTVLIMIFIGLSLYRKYDINSIVMDLSMLIIRSGIGFIVAAVYCLLIHARGENLLMYAVLTQGAVAMWPYIIIDLLANQYKTDPPGESLAMRMISFSFPLAIIIMLILFNLGARFTDANSPAIITDLGISGAVITFVGLVLYFLPKHNEVTAKQT
jgi:predicted permease